MATLKQTKIRIGDSKEFPNPKKKRGWSAWIENGVWYTARTVSQKKFGQHDYDGKEFGFGVRDCQCGCFMLSSSSGGEVDPFGKCPNNPIIRKPKLRTLVGAFAFHLAGLLGMDENDEELVKKYHSLIDEYVKHIEDIHTDSFDGRHKADGNTRGDNSDND